MGGIGEFFQRLGGHILLYVVDVPAYVMFEMVTDLRGCGTQRLDYRIYRESIRKSWDHYCQLSAFSMISGGVPNKKSLT